MYGIYYEKIYHNHDLRELGESWRSNLEIIIITGVVKVSKVPDIVLALCCMLVYLWTVDFHPPFVLLTASNNGSRHDRAQTHSEIIMTHMQCSMRRWRPAHDHGGHNGRLFL